MRWASQTITLFPFVFKDKEVEVAFFTAGRRRHMPNHVLTKVEEAGLRLLEVFLDH